MRIEAEGITDIGRVRRKNEDAFLVAADGRLAAVADGMGGHEAGEVASGLALESLAASLGDASQPSAEAVRNAVLRANRRVFEESVERGHVQGMGTTLTALWVPGDDGQAWIGHVGDSRCLRWRAGRFEQLTRDHSWVQAQVDSGLLTPEAALTHPMRNVITRSIGFEPEIEVDVIPVDLAAGDVFLLCSDGLSGKLSSLDLAVRIGSAVAGDEAPGPVLRDLVDEANNRGGEDNITAIWLRILDGAG